MLKALLVLEIFKFLPWLFVRVKNDMIRKLSLISKFMTSQTEQQNNYNTPITQYLKTTRQWKLLSWRRNAQHYKLVLKPHINSKIIFIQNKYPYTAQQYWEKASKYSYILPVLGQLPPRKIVLQPEILRVGLSISQALTVTGGAIVRIPILSIFATWEIFYNYNQRNNKHKNFDYRIYRSCRSFYQNYK